MKAITKICLSCFRNRALADFYKRRGRPIESWCKPCSRLRSREWRKKNLAKARESSRSFNRKHRAKRRSQGRPLKTKPHVRERQKARAGMLVQSGLRAGKVKKPKTCERCHKPHPHLHAHHKDYRKPLAVVWLCPPCHGIEHRV